MKKVASALIFVFAAVTSMNAQAQEGNAWTDCGLGGLIGGSAFDKGSSKAKITSVIVNVNLDLGTTALTSLTASPDTCGNMAGEVAAFVGENFDQLAAETAQGEGEHLATLMTVAGCAADSTGSVVASLRGEMAEQVTARGYGDKPYADKAEAYYQAVMTATGQCQA